MGKPRKWTCERSLHQWGPSGYVPPKAKPLEVLNAIADVVLSYRPKSKVKKARKRKKRKKHGS